MLARADGAGPRTVALLGSWRRGRAHGGDEPVPDPRQTRIAPGAAAWAAPDGDAAACQGSEPSDYPVRSGIGSGRRARNPALACRATQIRRRYAEADPSSGPSPTRSCAAAGRASMPAPGASMGCRGPGTQWAASACRPGPARRPERGGPASEQARATDAAAAPHNPTGQYAAEMPCRLVRCPAQSHRKQSRLSAAPFIATACSGTTPGHATTEMPWY